MAWYDDENDLAHVATYKNDKDASRDAQNAARKGWMPQGTAATEGHVNVGRTALKVFALGLPFLVTGASRTKGKVTLTFVRTPEWLARRQTHLARVEETSAAQRVAREKTKAAEQATHEDAIARRKEAAQRLELNQALKDGSRGHVTKDQPMYEVPDMFGKPSGVLRARSAFDLVSKQGLFGRVRVDGEAETWIRLEAIVSGEPELQPVPPEPVPLAARPTEKTCPRCAELVKFAAQVCRYCGHEFGQVPSP
jgi:hypothetical protein